MSFNYASEIDRYSRPELPSRAEMKYKFDDINNLGTMSNTNVQQSFDARDYPTSAKHSRLPVLINCDGCSDLAMTDIEY